MIAVAYAAALLVALVMGVLRGTWLSPDRSIRTFSAELFLGIGKAMIRNLAPPMRALLGFASAAAAAFVIGF